MPVVRREDPEDVARSYDRLLAQAEWVLRDAGADDATLARAIVAELKGKPDEEEFARANELNTVRRLTLLLFAHAPNLSYWTVVSIPARLELVASGQGSIADVLHAVRGFEQAPASDPLQDRLRASLGEAHGVADLWALEGRALATRLERLRTLLATPECQATYADIATTVGGRIAARVQAARREGELIEKIRMLVPQAGLDISADGGSPEAWEQARHLVDEALRVDPCNREALLMRASLNAAAGTSLDEASADIAQVLTMDPEDWRAFLVRSRVSRARGDIAAERQDIELAGSLPQTHVLARMPRCGARMDSGDLAGAESDAEWIVRAAPRDARGYWFLGRIKALRGDREAALRSFATALAIDPAFIGALLARSELYEGSGELDLAHADAQRAVEIDANSLTLQRRGIVRLRAGDLPGAEQDLTAALAHRPGHFGAIFNRGLTRQLRGDLQGAIADFRQSVAINPAHANAHMSLGMLLLDAGQREGADELRAALSVAPPDWEHRDYVEQRLGVFQWR